MVWAAEQEDGGEDRKVFRQHIKLHRHYQGRHSILKFDESCRRKKAEDSPV